MNCPTCQNEMRVVASAEYFDIHWCESCGTIRDGMSDEAPKYFERAIGEQRRFCEILDRHGICDICGSVEDACLCYGG